MRIDKDIIPLLFDAAELTVKEELAAYDKEDFDPTIHYDPNDIIIFDSFVIPALKVNINYGFYSHEMLNKGFGFMVGLIPWYLKEYEEKIQDECFGKLALLYYNYNIKEAISYMMSFEPKQIKASIGYINEHLGFSQLKFNSGKNSDEEDNPGCDKHK